MKAEIWITWKNRGNRSVTVIQREGFEWLWFERMKRCININSLLPEEQKIKSDRQWPGYLPNTQSKKVDDVYENIPRNFIICFIRKSPFYINNICQYEWTAIVYTVPNVWLAFLSPLFLQPCRPVCHIQWLCILLSCHFLRIITIFLVFLGFIPLRQNLVCPHEFMGWNASGFCISLQVYSAQPCLPAIFIIGLLNFPSSVYFY